MVLVHHRGTETRRKAKKGRERGTGRIFAKVRLPDGHRSSVSGLAAPTKNFKYSAAVPLCLCDSVVIKPLAHQSKLLAAQPASVISAISVAEPRENG
jgi:hypothetical protein